MYTVIRQYSGQGAAQLFDELGNRRSEVESIIREVPGLVNYTLVRTDNGGATITVCQDKAGAEESTRLAGEWVKENMSIAVDPPTIFEGEALIHFGS